MSTNATKSEVPIKMDNQETYSTKSQSAFADRGKKRIYCHVDISSQSISYVESVLDKKKVNRKTSNLCI